MHGTQMGRTGRKRNAIVARTASGQHSRAGQAREFPPAQVKRLREAAMHGLRDPEWATELGRLYLENRIDHAMYAAGKRWAEYAERYRRHSGFFPTLRTSTGEQRGASHPIDPESDRGREIAEQEADAAEKFFKADAVLVQAGPDIGRAVRRLCEDNEMVCCMADLISVRAGLMHLVQHWNLTGSSKSDSAGNAR